MKHHLILLCLISLFVMSACGKKDRTIPRNYDYSIRHKREVVRTDTLQKSEQTAKEPNPSSSPSGSSSASSSSSPSSYDNMRGFDPASENDMEDNGMSRFMENNDEEGWD